MTRRQCGRRALAALQHAPDLVVVVGPDERIVDANHAARSVLGRDPAEVAGSTLRALAHPDDAATAGQLPLDQPLDVRLRHRDGSWRTLEVVAVDLQATAVGGIAVYGRDVTARRVAEAQLRHRLQHDPLTGLPLRGRFEELVAGELAEPRSDGTVAVLAVHLGGLQLVNQSLGSAAGDRVTAVVADRLVRTLAGDTHVGRHGSDLVACRVVDGSDGARELAALVATVLGEPVVVGTEELFVPVTVGVAVAPPAGIPAGELLGEAVAALRRARRRRVPVELSEPDLRREATRWVQTQSALQRALERDELRLEYQPIIDLRTGELRSLEALLRWDQPRLGTMAPNQFIPIAEEVGAITPIGRWAVHAACRQLAHWQQRYDHHFGVSVNVSPRQLDRSGLGADVLDALSASAVEPTSLTLEMTESAILGGNAGGGDLDRLHSSGVSVAVDDFGTGFSSLGQLRDLPVDILKLDRSFVRHLAEPAGPDLAIVNSIIGLAGALGLTTVAEGVETAEQAECLRQVGCDHAQGFLFSPPQPPEVVDEMIGHGVLTGQR